MTTSSSHPSRPSAGAILLQLAIGLLLGIGLGEALVRLLMPQQLIRAEPGLFETADTLGWRFRRGIALPVNTGERTVTVYTDQEHFRVGRAGRREAEREVLLLGDSFIAALQVEHESSIAGLLESALGDSIAVRNAGVPAWDPPQYLIRARQLLTPGRFDAVVVFVYVGNDVVTARRDYWRPSAIDQPDRFRWPRQATWEELVASIGRPVNSWLEERSHLFLLVKNRTQVLRMRLGLAPEYFPEEFLRATATSSRWSVTVELLDEVAQLAEEGDRPVLFVLLPAPWQTEPMIFAEYASGLGIDTEAVDLGQPSRILADSLKRRGRCVLDVLPAFRSAAEGGKRLFGVVDRHLSPQGHSTLGAILTSRVVQLLEVPRQCAWRRTTP